MLYRVDYIVAVMLAGFALGALLSRPTAGVSSSRLARSYYIVAIVLSVLRAGVFTEGMLGSHAKSWSIVGGYRGSSRSDRGAYPMDRHAGVGRSGSGYVWGLVDARP
jgi:hypothetical protein